MAMPRVCCKGLPYYPQNPACGSLPAGDLLANWDRTLKQLFKKLFKKTFF
jgi:hypothetical protein